jgi:hypothetical protein
MLTNEEIQFVKELYQKTQADIQVQATQKKVNDALKIIADKFQPLLNQAEQDGDIELRKQLIEQQTLEAKAKEEEIRNN